MLTLKKYETQIYDASQKIFKNEKILEEESMLLKTLNTIENQFNNFLFKLQQINPSFYLDVKDDDVSFSTTKSYLKDVYYISCNFTFKKQLVLTKIESGFFSQEEYLLNKKIEEIFLSFDLKDFSLFFEFISSLKDYTERLKSLSKDNFEEKKNIIKNFFEVPHPRKDFLKEHIKRDVNGYQIYFDETKSLAYLYPYFYKYNRYQGYLERNQSKTTYKEAKNCIDLNIVVNNTFIQSFEDIKQHLPIFEEKEFVYKDRYGSSRTDKKICCNIDFLIQFINCSNF